MMKERMESLTTEKINENSQNIDKCSTFGILKIINGEDKFVAQAVEKELHNIEKAVDAIKEKLDIGGRLFYVGAGTSGRIGILDASECPPTFGTDPDLVQAVIAGGDKAVFYAVEGAEDDEEQGCRIIAQRNIENKDAVVGITSSGRTPFVLGAVREAKRHGILTIGLSNNENSIIKTLADIAITPIVGPEAITGSTRMKAGTSQKMVLNMISTAVMVKMGKVYQNLMVDLKPTNTKLKDRAIRIVMNAAQVKGDDAEHYLSLASFNPKTAIVMIKRGVNKNQAEKLLCECGGYVYKAIEHR